MSFKYSVIGDNTIENREHLEKIGYEDISVDQTTYEGLLDCDNYDSTFFAFKNSECGEKYSKVLCDLGYINCIGNPALFQAVTAMRDDSDYMQWFKTDFENKLIPDVKEMYLCKSREFRGITVKYKGEDFVIGSAGFHKATKDEIIKRFTNDENMQ